MIINAEQFGPKVVDWVSCIAENYGQQALQDAGVISGFTVNGDVTGISENTAEMQEAIAEHRRDRPVVRGAAGLQEQLARVDERDTADDRPDDR